MKRSLSGKAEAVESGKLQVESLFCGKGKLMIKLNQNICVETKFN